MDPRERIRYPMGIVPIPEVILHIAGLDPGTQSYPQTLFVPGEPPLVDALPAAELSSSPWTPDSLRKRIAEPKPGNDLVEAGRTLFRWMIRGAIANRWATLATPRPPSIILRLEAPELSGIPWELACAGEPDNPIWLGRLGLVRAHPKAPAPDPSGPWPLRILLAVGCGPQDEAYAEVAAEVAHLERTFVPWGRSVDLQVVPQPTSASLETWIRTFKPHVFHFAGHAGLHHYTRKPGLIFEPPNEPRWVLDVAALPTLILDNAWFPRFVFLNACSTAGNTVDSASIQHAFLTNGVPAVLAMQADIRGSLAGLFAASLYQACAEGSCIREATRRARRTLIAEGLSGQHLRPEWVLPSLTLAHPEHIPTARPVFQHRRWPDSEAFRTCTEFEETRFFANFREPRRAIIQWIHPVNPATSDPADPPSTPPRILVLHGAPRCGKSHLAKWCLESLASPSLRIRYVTHQHPGASSCLDLLRQIRDGELAGQPNPPPSSLELLHAPLPETHFHACNLQINHVLEHGRGLDFDATPAADPAGPPVRDQHLPLRPLGENVLATLFSAFQEALESLLRESSLLLALDLFSVPEGARRLNPKDLELVLKRVLLPLVRHPELAGRLHLLVVASSDDLQHYRLNDLLGPTIPFIKLRHDQPSAELARCAHEMFHHRHPDLFSPLLPILDLATDQHGLARLRTLRDLVDKLPPWKENLWVDRMR